MQVVFHRFQKSQSNVESQRTALVFFKSAEVGLIPFREMVNLAKEQRVKPFVPFIQYHETLLLPKILFAVQQKEREENRGGLKTKPHRAQSSTRGISCGGLRAVGRH